MLDTHNLQGYVLYLASITDNMTSFINDNEYIILEGRHYPYGEDNSVIISNKFISLFKLNDVRDTIIYDIKDKRIIENVGNDYNFIYSTSPIAVLKQQENKHWGLYGNSFPIYVSSDEFDIYGSGITEILCCKYFESEAKDHLYMNGHGKYIYCDTDINNVSRFINYSIIDNDKYIILTYLSYDINDPSATNDNQTICINKQDKWFIKYEKGITNLDSNLTKVDMELAHIVSRTEDLKYTKNNMINIISDLKSLTKDIK